MTVLIQNVMAAATPLVWLATPGGEIVYDVNTRTLLTGIVWLSERCQGVAKVIHNPDGSIGFANQPPTMRFAYQLCRRKNYWREGDVGLFSFLGADTFTDFTLRELIERATDAIT